MKCQFVVIAISLAIGSGALRASDGADGNAAQAPDAAHTQPRQPDAAPVAGIKDPLARWATRLDPMPLKGILGRPSRFVVSDNELVAPLGSAVAQRATATGFLSPFEVRWFNSPVAQVARGPWSGTICTLSAAEGTTSSSAWRLDRIIRASAQEMTGHDEAPWRVVAGQFHHCCTCADDGRIILWDTTGPKALATIQGYGRRPDGGVVRGEFAAFSPYGRWLATVYDDRITFRLAHTGRTMLVWQPKLEDSQHVMAIRFDTNGNNLLAFVQDSKEDDGKRTRLLRFNVDTQREDRIDGSRAAAWGFALCDDETVVSFDGSAEIVAWNAERGEQNAMFKAAPHRVYDLQLAPAGDILATVGDDNVVKFWDTITWKQRDTNLNYSHDGAKVVQFSPSGKYLATLSEDGWLKVWDAPRFCLDGSPRFVGSAQPQFGHEEYENGMIRDRLPDGTVTETRADGTVKTYKQQ